MDSSIDTFSMNRAVPTQQVCQFVGRAGIGDRPDSSMSIWNKTHYFPGMALIQSHHKQAA